MEISLEVPQGDQGMRLDRFIQRHIPRLSRTRVQGIVERGMRDQRGRAVKPAQRVCVGDVFVWRREVEVEAVRPFSIPIVHEDAELLVLNKPGDLVVHPTARVWRHTVTAWLREHRPEAKIAHRLDRETSGVLLCGKGGAAPWLKERFRLGQAHKTYWAIVKGEPSFESRLIDLPLQLDAASPLKVKMKVDARGLRSVTRVRVIERLPGHALVECRPETGRQHQIRVHLWAIGLPLLGDKLYGVDEDVFREAADHGVTDRVLAATGAARHMLHAAELAFAGADGQPLGFSAPMHEDMCEILERLRLRGAGDQVCQRMSG